MTPINCYYIVGFCCKVKQFYKEVWNYGIALKALGENALSNRLLFITIFHFSWKSMCKIPTKAMNQDF